MVSLNRTHAEHAVFAALIQLALAPIMGPVNAGIAATLVFFAREYAQVEYKMRDYDGASIARLMPWDVLRSRHWSADGVLDFLVPAVTCAFVAFVYVYFD